MCDVINKWPVPVRSTSWKRLHRNPYFATSEKKLEYSGGLNTERVRISNGEDQTLANRGPDSRFVLKAIIKALISLWTSHSKHI